VFKRETGYTINQYLLYLRLLATAERMVEQPTTDLTTIAFDYGFASHSHLSAAFRQMFGVSPSAFRRAANGRSLRQMSKILKV